MCSDTDGRLQSPGSVCLPKMAPTVLGTLSIYRKCNCTQRRISFDYINFKELARLYTAPRLSQTNPWLIGSAPLPESLMLSHLCCKIVISGSSRRGTIPEDPSLPLPSQCIFTLVVILNSASGSNTVNTKDTSEGIKFNKKRNERYLKPRRICSFITDIGQTS